MPLSFEWKVNFALILSGISLLISIVRWRLDKYEARRLEKRHAYENAFDDANYVLTYPFKHKTNESLKREYQHQDLEIQTAVRRYVSSHWMERWLSGSEYIPDHIADEKERQEFLALVEKEAEEFKTRLQSDYGTFELQDFSPVFYLENAEVTERLNRLMTEIGRHYSLFSPEIQKAWDGARVTEPNSVQNNYIKSLEVCKEYFIHNGRDFDDPFYDLVQSICHEYRRMTRSKSEKFSNLLWKIKGKYKF